MATAWKVATGIAVGGWFLTPVITFFVSKIIAFLGFDSSREVAKLELSIIVDLEKTLPALDEARMLDRGGKWDSEMKMLNNMAAKLRHAREEADDILDAHDVIQSYRNRCRDHLCGAAATCIACFLGFFSGDLVNNADLAPRHDDLPGRFGASVDELADKLKHRLHSAVATFKSSCLRLQLWAGMLNHHSGYCGTIYGAVESSMWIVLLWPGKILTRCWNGLRVTVERLCTRWIASITPSLSGSTLTLRPPPVRVQGALSSNDLILDIADDEAVSQATLSESSSNNAEVILDDTPSESASVPDAISEDTPSGSASQEQQPLVLMAVHPESASRQQGVHPESASHQQGVPVATPPSCSSLGVFKTCCRSILQWITETYENACIYRDWSYNVVGITTRQDALDYVITAISRGNLKKRIEEIEITVNEVKKSFSSMVDKQSQLSKTEDEGKKSAQLSKTEDEEKKSSVSSVNKERRDIRIPSKKKVFGVEWFRNSIMAKLLQTTSSSTSTCFSAIGIYGIAGSGKTTFARYTRDYIMEECKDKHFHTVMCIHLSETFNVKNKFHDMLEDITNDRHSDISDLEKLKEKLKKSLCGKRFLLILDDLCVKDKDDTELEKLISPLNVGLEGSKILVTAQTTLAAGILCADEPIKMPGLHNIYLSILMDFALGGTTAAHKGFIPYGRVIARKVHSPIGAAIVARQLGANRNIDYWRRTAKFERWNDTMDAVWWSYKQLSPDIRRCFEYCNIFPKRTTLRKNDLVVLWMAHGFVKTSSQTKDKKVVAEGYIETLLSLSFLEHENNERVDDDCFIINDTLHELLDMVAGSDYFRIEDARTHRDEGQKPVVPRDVRHLFVRNYDAELINAEIPGLDNLRTLIIYVVDKDTPVEEKVIETICKLLPKLRVLAIAFSKMHDPIKQPKKFSFPESISMLKQLCYLAFRTSKSCEVIWPSALDKLEHIKMLDFGCAEIYNIGRLSSMQERAEFTVRDEEGYELHQLGGLNELCGTLEIFGLGKVKSECEAVKACLSLKKRLRKLRLYWPASDCIPEVVQLEAVVLENLCPPVELQELEIQCYKASTYPSWMHDREEGDPMDLKHLSLTRFGQRGPPPRFVQAFSFLRRLEIWQCKWDALPSNMKDLTFLEYLMIYECPYIESLPTLPKSVKSFHLSHCNEEFMESCKTPGHENHQKVKHIPNQNINPKPLSSAGVFPPGFWELGA